ncbi:glycosyltransferase [Aestuariivirga litoralis]|uniref:glycosyltransferase n=1 Tax=Aestuariivirga litoralis TaxID=2650924 RepID=UPI0018C6B39C|nr:glycosyltransferase [Aestuariivirga litoralis]MBG1233587.1 glycosyltransferase [Aestuariivirga litoralis]
MTDRGSPLVFSIANFGRRTVAKYFRREGSSSSANISPSSIQLPVAPALPDVSIIIPVHGQISFTLKCLKSIGESRPNSSYEVIVIDDASDAGDLAILRQVNGIRLIENTSNLGFLRSCNKAASKARGKYFHFLNNDTEVFPGTIDRLVELAAAHPDVGLVGSKFIFPDGKLQEAGGIVWRDASAWNYGRGENPNLPRFNYVREVDYISGASILVPRKVWKALKGFDEYYSPAYYEDTDFAFRVRQHGMRVLYQPRSVVMHHEGVSNGKKLSQGVKSYQVDNHKKFLSRWAEDLQKNHFPVAEHLLRACDHAMHKPIVLIIDHYLPEPDRDAGSRAILALVQSLVDLGCIVKFWPQNGYYTPGYHDILESIGVEVLQVDTLASQLATLGNIGSAGALGLWLKKSGADINAVFLSRPHIAAELLPALQKHARAKIAYYGHDLHFLRLQREAKAMNAPEILGEAAKWEKMERHAWSASDVVLYPSDEEVNTVKELSPRTDVRRLQLYAFSDFIHRTKQPDGSTLLFVAGFGHPPNIDAAIWFVSEIFPHVKKLRPGIRLVIAGSNPRDSVKALAAPDIEVTGTLSAEELVRRYAIAKLAVVPLRIGAGVKLKVVEAMQMGVPLVTTSVGAQGLPGFMDFAAVKDQPQQFAKEILRLLDNPRAALALSKKQSAYVEKMFSYASLRADLRVLLKDLGCPALPGDQMDGAEAASRKARKSRINS